MAYLQLQPHVGYGLACERAVFLDLRRDRYLALDRPAEEAFRRIRTAQEPVLAEPGARDLLLSTGLFREGSLRGRLAPASVPAPVASLLDRTAQARPGWTALWRAWRAVSRARTRLASVPLLEIVAAIRESRYAAPPGNPAAAEKGARAFLAARPMVPLARSCLMDSLALLEWLGDDARHATLVFGVRIDPFGAHCWLQTERVLLTDAHDTVGTFVPVLSV